LSEVGKANSGESSQAEGSAAEPKNRTASDGTVTVQSPESAPEARPQDYESLSTWVLVDKTAPEETQPTPSSKETAETVTPLPQTGTVAELMDLPELPPPPSGPTQADLDYLKREIGELRSERLVLLVALAMSSVVAVVAVLRLFNVL
jgi:hypothetical protein